MFVRTLLRMRPFGAVMRSARRIRFAPPVLGALAIFGAASAQAPTAVAAPEFVEGFLKASSREGVVVVFSKHLCPWCHRLKDFLVQEGIPFRSIELDDLPTDAPPVPEIGTYLIAKTGQRTVPNIFIAGQHIGGHQQFMEAFKSGRIHSLLEPHGITPSSPKPGP